MVSKRENLVRITMYFHMIHGIIDSMNTGSILHQRTLSVRVDMDEADLELFQKVIGEYNRLWGDIAAWCNDNQTVNRTRMQKSLYHKARKKYPDLPAQFVCIALRDAAGAVKSWNSNNKHKRWQLKSVRRKQTINYDRRIMALRGGLLTLSTLTFHKRFKALIDLPDWFFQRYPGSKINAAKLSLKNGYAIIHLIYRVNPTTTCKGTQVVGIDRGIRNIITTSKGGEYSSAKVRGIKRKYAHNRATLQAKGTRSAKRRLKAISGKEKRFISDVNHQISKTLASDPEVKTYVLEDLNGISKKKEKSSRKAGKKLRTWLSNWSYAELEFFLTYKCDFVGKTVELVPAAFTSQRCNRCGFTDKKNRNGARFDCKQCGHSAHADHNAAKNIRDKYLFAIDSKAGRSQSPTWMESPKNFHVQAPPLVGAGN